MRRRLVVPALVPVLVPVLVAALLTVSAGVAGAHPEGDPPQPGPGEPAGVLVTPTG